MVCGQGCKCWRVGGGFEGGGDAYHIAAAGGAIGTPEHADTRHALLVGGVGSVVRIPADVGSHVAERLRVLDANVARQARFLAIGCQVARADA